MSILLNKLVRSVIIEAVQKSRAAVEREIHDTAKSLFGDVFKTGTKSRHGEIRLQPVDSKFRLTQEQIADLLMYSGHPIESEANPGDSLSKSGKFKTYITTTGHSIVFAGGGNAGQTRETTLVSELLEIIAGAPPTPHLADLLNQLHISPTDIASANLASAKRVKRQFALVPKDVGEVISDITLGMKDGTNIFISLKLNTGGGLSISNFGYGGAFSLNASSGTVNTTDHQYDSLLQAIGLSKQKIAKGLQSIVRGDPMTDVTDSSPTFNSEDLRGYMSSAYGYGYWYVTESKSGWHVVDLTTQDKLIEYIGEPYVEKIVYPGISLHKAYAANSRTRAVVVCDDRRYEFVIRNTEGTGIIPTKILVDVK
jgi:hypothetical protein